MDNIRFFSRSLKLALLAAIIACLTSCSHVKRHDGAPNFYVDETKVPNAVPKVEPLAKFGNMPSYRVFGKRYYTLKTSRHYDEIGTASWYGTMFHAQRTSSGEPYDMLAMTAAHKTLPLPTYVEVTNLKNRRKIIVKVNDRGPFESNRIIDLSYVAAKKLGMLGHGTALVRVKAIDPLIYGKPAPVIAHRIYRRETPVFHSNAPRVYFQVGAFRDRQRAERLRERLATLVDAPVNISHGHANLYRVHVGPVRDTAEAERLTYRLKGLGLKANKQYRA
jgi:rare lipoprotein A